jgi:AAA domain/UvrD-like helicase C-terminal domain
MSGSVAGGHGVQHLSMRVPWRDRPWDGAVCVDPLANSSCTLLANIGPKRDDQYEELNAGVPVDQLDSSRLPCLSERGTFMSPVGYSVTKSHPYAWTKALQGLRPSPVIMPPYAFEAVPFRWLNRTSFNEEIGLSRVPDFDPTAEQAAIQAIGWKDAGWIMDGRNQKAVISEFFAPVAPGHSLVFTYLKHSPLQEQRTDRLIVGVARVTRVTLPTWWDSDGKQAFPSSMWETAVEHSLRPSMEDGVLLPYQALISLLDGGVDVGPALAWAPEGRFNEFSYVTEHLSDDAALEALGSVSSAMTGMADLGIELPASAREWVAEQTERLWQLRGPAPGLGSVLTSLGVERSHLAARLIMAAAPTDPWSLLETALADPGTLPADLRPLITKTNARIWSRLEETAQQCLKVLSAMDISPAQVSTIMNGKTDVELPHEDLVGNPYLASLCTYGQLEHVPFALVDRACFPAEHVDWVAPFPASAAMDGNLDERRIEALVTEVLEAAGTEGDTLLPEAEVIDRANQLPLTRSPALTAVKLLGADLDHETLSQREDPWPLVAKLLADGSPALKLCRFEDTSTVIRDFVTSQLARPRLGELTNPRRLLDAALAGDIQVAAAGQLDDLEETARTEKAAGLSVLHDSPLSVLIGAAGTGKTTLLKSLVGLDRVSDGGVLLLAPTGKARVQLETKVELSAKTLASYLTPSGRYEVDSSRYRVVGPHQRASFGLVVIDEASMLTEEMLAATFDSFASVRRLVLVGDPRQLPPIGPGRPFVDLVNRLQPEKLETTVRVGDNYIELQVPRRQRPDGTHGPRKDLELAAWFGHATRGAGDESIWAELATTPDLQTLRYESWGHRSAVEALSQVMSEELDLSGHANQSWAFALTYGAVLSGQYLNWELGAGKRAEDWQILSPTRSRAFGTVELNRHLKRAYRVDDTAMASKNLRWNTPYPIGPEMIVRGDKVMQTENRRIRAWPRDAGALDYVANGEIGVGIGRLQSPKYAAKKTLRMDVEFSSQPAVTYGYWPTSGDSNVPLELAWAITVHKSQGSEFGVTFLIIPSRTNVSRELMYTALTRQKDRVIILHDGTLSGLRELAHPWRSETARRLTDLFTAPDPVTLEQHAQLRRFDRKLMHVSTTGVPMASKNEIIIAEILERLVPGLWEYEKPLRGTDGREVLPDFTVHLSDGRTVYWEHAGMLDVPDYAAAWAKKVQWYAENGIHAEREDGDHHGTLMWTDDLGGADAKAWLGLAMQVFRVDLPGEPSKVPRRRATRSARSRQDDGSGADAG